MHVLYDGLIYATQAAGGINRYFANIIERLPEDMRATLTTPEVRDVNFPAHDRLQVHVPHSTGTSVPAKVARTLQLRRAERGFGHDLAHPTYYAAQTLRAVRRMRTPVVVTVWDMTHERFRSELDPRSVHAWFKRRAVTQADALLCISANTRDDLLEYYDVDASRVHVIPLATDLSAEAVTGTERTPDRPYILYVGARASYKNFDAVLRAMTRFDGDIRDVALCVVGAPLTVSEQARIAALGLSDRVETAGVADDARVAALYASSIALVYPSRYEGFGIPPLEAMACGTVAITSNTSSIPEVVGDAALTFDPDDVELLVEHVRTAATDSAKRATLLERGRERAAQFSWDRTAASTFDIYRSLVG